MGKAKAKGKRITSTTNKNDDPAATGEDEKILAQKRKGRLQKPLADDEKIEKIEEQEDPVADDDENSISDVKRKRNKEAKEKGNSNVVKKESPNGTLSNSFRHIGSRRKNKPHRAAEVGVECT